MDLQKPYQKQNKPGLTLDTPVQFIKGVGPHLGSLMSKRGISTVNDLLEFYPRAYEDRRAARNISSLNEGEIVSLKANVLKVSSVNLGRSSRKIYDVTVSDQTGRIHCKFFRVPYRGYFERFQPGLSVRIVGKVTNYRGNLEFHHPDIFDATEEEADSKDQIMPIYVEAEGISTRRLSKMLDTVLKTGASLIPERLPSWMLSNYELPTRFDSLKCIHQPPENASPSFFDLQSTYHHRIIFEEFFWLELSLLLRKNRFQKEDTLPVPSNHTLVEKLVKSLPFELTGAQKWAFKEIAEDLAKPHPMHRLVQGDVGSGKTMVALMSAVLAATSGMQTALMVPTEIYSTFDASYQ